jgi:uncharacterized membrane protein YqaE (UPF0057 family)
MRYFLAIVLPPVAVILCGRPIQFALNVLLTLCFWVPGAVHALLVVKDHKDNKRTKTLARALRK